MQYSDEISARRHAIIQRIQKMQQAPLASPDVRFIAVSKGQPAEAITPLLEAGHFIYAENRVQEAQGKWESLKRRYPQIQLHLIGSLQTNKVKEALALFDAIHTVDREKLVDALAKELNRSPVTHTPAFFIQVNTGQEPQKGGVLPSEARALLDYCRLRGLAVTGLMCVPPVNDAPAPHFALLHKMAREFALPHLSMGMSGDFEAAVRFGATHVRIGTALFGERPAQI